MDIFVARQPVFPLDKTVFGYEMLFKNGFKNAFPDIDGNTATSNVLSNLFFSFNFTELLDGKHGLINPMMKLCQIIKFDLIATPLNALEKIIEHIYKNYKITLLAEKVETYDEFEQAKNLGFTLLQGYFFSKPEILSNGLNL